MERLDKTERRKLFGKYILDDVFDILYDTLDWAQQQTDDLYPEEVWHEALLFADKVRTMVRPHRQLPMLLADMYYPTANGALLVQLATLWGLMPEAVGNEPLLESLRWLKSYVEHEDLYAEFVIRVGDYEDSQLLEGKRVNLLERHLCEVSDSPTTDDEERQQLMGDVVNEALRMGKECAEMTLVTITAINKTHHHAYLRQQDALVQGIQDMKEGRQVVLFQYVKQDNQNSQVFSGSISNSQFGR